MQIAFAVKQAPIWHSDGMLTLSVCVLVKGLSDFPFLPTVPFQDHAISTPEIRASGRVVALDRQI